MGRLFLFAVYFETLNLQWLEGGPFPCHVTDPTKLEHFSCPLQQSIYLPCLALSTSVTWGFLQELRSTIILGRSWASRNLWDLVVVWEWPVTGQRGALVGKGVHCVYVEEEWLLKNEVMGPGSALRDYGNHWPERDGVTFMQKWLRSGTVLQPLWG